MKNGLSGPPLLCRLPQLHSSEMMSHKQAQKNAGGKSGAKGSCSLQDRFREMGAQEQLIEQKKREIESKMKEKKQKEQEEMLNKMQAKLMAAKKAEQARARYCVFSLNTSLLWYMSRSSIIARFQADI